MIGFVGAVRLRNRRILLGITGGIAAYKSAELVRLLRAAGAEVRVVMTAAATNFVGPLTFQALSGNPVHLHLLDPEAESGMGHIELARWAEVVVIAPASANFIAKLAHGLADDLLSTLCLATKAPLVLAPAMNRQMWANLATQANVSLLAQRGLVFLGPVEGEQACGDVGLGRMLDADKIVAELSLIFGPQVLDGVHVLITAGPTREPIDPVRFISNRSSGKMGFALADAAVRAGAKVTLICGPVALTTPRGATRIDVTTAQEMRDAVFGQVARADILIATAAVADYQPKQAASQKLKKQQAEMQLALVRTPDILGEIAALSQRPFTVGFAAETENLASNAQAKRLAKRLDIIAANWVNNPQMGFDSDENELTLFWEGGEKHLARSSKTQLAHQLIVLVSEFYHAKNSTKNS